MVVGDFGAFFSTRRFVLDLVGVGLDDSEVSDSFPIGRPPSLSSTSDDEERESGGVFVRLGGDDLVEDVPLDDAELEFMS